MTQPEYVKMLYALQKNPGGKQDIIAALRRRGIDFAVTDGIRSLTRSKAANDEELRRALEEAGRKRSNPELARLPDQKEADAILAKARENNLAAVKDMPDFVVKQLIARSEAYAGTGNWKPVDNLTIAVSYSEKDGEQYKVLAINGARVNAERGSNYSGLDGATTGGEFVKTLEKIFKPENKTEFEAAETDIIRGRRAFVFNYKIEVSNNKVGITYEATAVSATVPSGEKGKVWIDSENGRVLKLLFEATDLPGDFPIKALNSSIDYDWVTIADEKYLLPILSDRRFTILSRGTLIQTKNLIRFKNYQKFGTDVKVLDEDSADMPVDEKPKP